MSGRNGIRGKRSGAPRGPGRTERLAEAGFVGYCKCPQGFKAWSPEVLKTMSRGDTRRFRCKVCGHHKPEWRCPECHLKAQELREPGSLRSSAGCPCCGRAPKEQRYDPYATKVARG